MIFAVGNEECDDGNRLDGDGCSADCKKEDGYTCDQASPCKMVGETCALEIPAVYRDFNARNSSGGHPDFEVGCGDHVKGLASAQLDNQGKPTLATTGQACIDSASSFSQWYRDTPPKNATIVSSLTLFPNGSGGFVNRYGANGEQWMVRTNENWASNDVSTCSVPGCHPCTWNAQQGCTSVTQGRDGSPLFFPIDDAPGILTDSRAVAGIPQPIYLGDWKDDPSGKLRNFHFTSEVTYWFQYTAGSTATLSFVGDDDVWVYVNRRLAIDLGGLHEPIGGRLTIAANGDVTLLSHEDTTNSNVSSFGLVDGGVYEIKVFHAERKKNGSSFQLTLSGFNTSRSECRSNCGDGIIGAGEECDDGVNDGGYNECQPGCKLGGYCGDGIRQENEQCDDNEPNAPANCRGCRVINIR